MHHFTPSSEVVFQGSFKWCSWVQSTNQRLCPGHNRWFECVLEGVKGCNINPPSNGRKEKLTVRGSPNNGWDSASLVALCSTCLLIKITLIAFPGLYNQLTFFRSNTGFLPSLAFTVTSFFSARITVFSLPWPLQTAYFFSAGLTVFSLPWPLQTAYLAPIFAENRSKS